MDILGRKPEPQKDYKEVKKEDTKTINALPDFEIRTMKDDLAGLGVKKLDKSLFFQDKAGAKPVTPGVAPPVPKKPQISEGAPEEKIEPKTEIAQKEESGMIVPENLPIAPITRKSPLPSIEELVKKEEESPLAPLPPPKTETFFEVPETPPPAPITPRQVPQITNAENFPQMDRVKIPEPVYAPERENIRKILRLVSIAIVVIAVIGGGAYFYFKNKTVEPTPVITPKAEPQLSNALISLEQTKILSLTGQNTILQLLREEAKTEQPLQTLKRIGILKTSSAGETTDFLTLSDILQGLEIPVSPYVFSELKNSYNLLMFNQKEGKRLGLIIEAENPENLKGQMKNWESTMLNDFKNFYLAQLPGQAASKNFLDDNYKNVIIRYKNLPFSTLTLNYTVLGNYLIIGTSKESIYSIIDRILVK